jgi:DNA-binding winged helix-turn-helix (wHTH) protein
LVQTAAVRFTFEGCELDLGRYEVRRDGDVVAVEPQVFDVLVHLVRHRDRVVSKEELLDEVCSAQEPRVNDTGWVPAESAAGVQWAWFWSRES